MALTQAFKQTVRAGVMMLERVIRTTAESGAVFLTMEEAAREFQQRAGQPARAKA